MIITRGTKSLAMKMLKRQWRISTELERKGHNQQRQEEQATTISMRGRALIMEESSKGNRSLNKHSPQKKLGKKQATWGFTMK